MAINTSRSNFLVAFAAGMLASVLAPVLIPAIKRSGRPLAKNLIRGGMVLYAKGREAVAHTGELVEDAIAEIHAEEAMRQQASSTAAGTETEPEESREESRPHASHTAHAAHTARSESSAHSATEAAQGGRKAGAASPKEDSEGASS